MQVYFMDITRNKDSVYGQQANNYKRFTPNL